MNVADSAAFRVLGFTPGTTSFLHATAGGLIVPLISLLIFGSALSFLAWDLVTSENPEAAGSVILALEAVALLSLAFLTIGAIKRTGRALIGRRPRRTADLTATWASIREGVHGDIELSWRLRPTESAVVDLICEVSSSSPESLAGAYRWYWQRTVDASACPPGQVTRVPVTFTLPSNAPPSGRYQLDRHEDRDVRWELQFGVEPDGPRHMVFTLPVTANAMPASLPKELSREPDDPHATRPAHSRVGMHDTATGGSEFSFPHVFGHTPLLVWTLLTAPSWFVLPWLAWRDQGDWPGNLAMMLLIAGAINGLALALLLQPRRLVVGADGVVIHRLLRRTRAHIWSVRRAVARPWISQVKLPTTVWLKRDPESDVEIYQCRSSREALWLTGEVNRALASAKAARTARAG